MGAELAERTKIDDGVRSSLDGVRSSLDGVRSSRGGSRRHRGARRSPRTGGGNGGPRTERTRRSSANRTNEKVVRGGPNEQDRAARDVSLLRNEKMRHLLDHVLQSGLLVVAARLRLFSPNLQHVLGPREDHAAVEHAVAAVGVPRAVAAAHAQVFGAHRRQTVRPDHVRVREDDARVARVEGGGHGRRLLELELEPELRVVF